MVKWSNQDTIILIPHYKDYNRRDFLNTWHSRKEFFQMINDNFHQLNLEAHYREKFGYYWNCYVTENSKGKLQRFSQKTYYRNKYLGKLGFKIDKKNKNKNKNKNNKKNKLTNGLYQISMIISKIKSKIQGMMYAFLL